MENFSGEIKSVKLDLRACAVSVIAEEGTPEEIFGAPKHPRLQDFLAKVL